MNSSELAATAAALVAPGKGILAADEDPGVLANRFERLALEATPEMARAYRDMLFSTPGLEGSLSGVILYDDMLRVGSGDGRRFPEILAGRCIIPGINADGGPHALAGSPDEFVTEGLDGLRGRLEAWYALGARFTKWRAAIRVGPGMPSRAAITANAHALARYAALSQEAGLVPLVEPDVMMAGDHDLAGCAAASEAIWQATYRELHEQGVLLEGTVLKTNMIVAGVDRAQQPPVEAVADATIRSLRRAVPAAVPGIAFLSGGQTDLQATQHLDAINRLGAQPWELTFCFGRALLEPVLTAWQGSAANSGPAQAAFRHRAAMNALARSGAYSADEEARQAA